MAPEVLHLLVPCPQIPGKEEEVLGAGEAVPTGSSSVKQKVLQLASAFGEASLILAAFAAFSGVLVFMAVALTWSIEPVANWMYSIPGADDNSVFAMMMALAAFVILMPLTIEEHYKQWTTTDYSNFWLRWICNLIGSPSEIQGPKKVWAYGKLVLVSIMASLIYACAFMVLLLGLTAYGCLPWPVWVKIAIPIALAISALTVIIYNSSNNNNSIHNAGC